MWCNTTFILPSISPQILIDACKLKYSLTFAFSPGFQNSCNIILIFFRVCGSHNMLLKFLWFACPERAVQLFLNIQILVVFPLFFMYFSDFILLMSPTKCQSILSFISLSFLIPVSRTFLEIFDILSLCRSH